MKRALIWIAAAAALAACQGDGGERAATSGEELPARTGPARPPEAQIEGQYALVAVQNSPLPAVLERQDPCHLELVDASLRMEAGRFAFQNRVREVCDQVAGEPVLHSAGGTYGVDGDQVVLRADIGDAFSEAIATADSTTLTIRRLTAEGGAQAVEWRFQRDDARLVPLPGSTGPGSRDGG